jgi:uncharacterized protein (TIGR02266 family)
MKRPAQDEAKSPNDKHVVSMLRRSRSRFKRREEAAAPARRPTATSMAPIRKLALVDMPRVNTASSPDASGAERREHKRKSLSVAVDMHTESNFFGGRTRDISIGGLFIETDVALDIGVEVAVNLWLGGTRYELASEVMWALTDAAGTRGIGVRFVRIPDKALRAIAAFIDERSPGLAVDDVELEPEGEAPDGEAPAPR